MIKRLTTKAIFAAGAATLTITAVSVPAEAAVITYTNRTAWQNALSALGQSATPQEQFNNNIANNATITFANGVISQGSGGTLRNRVDNGDYDGWVDQVDTDVFDQITWTFPSLTRGFGADWSSTASSAGLQVTIGSDIIVFGNVLGNPGTGFLGFISDTAFSSVTFTDVAGTGAEGESFSADNLSYGRAVVPTPALLPGLIGMGVAAWRKRKREAAESKD